MTHPRPRLVVPALLALACLAPAADHGWTGAPGDSAPAGWTASVGKPAAAKATAPTVRFLDGAVEIAGVASSWALAGCALDQPDATDANPLRVSAMVSAAGDRPLEGGPAMLALVWPGGVTFAVGLGDDPHIHRDERRAWALWSAGGKTGQTHAESDLGAGASPVHLRLVVTAREVAAYGSRDGWNWTRVAAQTRAAIGATGKPQRLLLGRGRIDAPDLAGDPGGGARPATYRFSELHATTAAAEVPASLLARYGKQESYADTMDALAKPGRPPSWRIRGPVAVPKGGVPVQLPEGFTAGEGWREQAMPENDRILQLGRLLPGSGGSMRYATATVKCESAGWVRLLYDGMRRCWVWVDGRQAGDSGGERDEAEPDRFASLVWLTPGEHQVVIGVRADNERASIALRWEPGDPLYRIALLRRLMVDFPEEGDLVAAPFEIARLWEGLGFAREAANALADLAKAPDGGDLAEKALSERARLLRQLGDEAGAAAEIDQLGKLWVASGTSDQLTAAMRTARLWQRLEVPDRAIAALAEAMKLPDLPATAKAELAIERARLQRRRGADAEVAADLRTAAEALPGGDQRRFELLASAIRTEVGAGAATQPSRLEEAAKLATTPLRARELAGLAAARKDDAAAQAARAAGAKLAPDSLDLLAVDVGEALAAAKDVPGAVAMYRQALAQVGAKAEGDALPKLRAALLRAVLAEREAGAKLLAAADAVPPGSVLPLTFKVAGPWRLENWKNFDTPPCDPAKADPAGKAGDKPWTDPPPEAVQGDSIDMSRCGMADDSVMLLIATIESDADREATASAGADDALSVWLNGQRIYNDRDQRGLTPDAIPLRLQLKKGRNVLMCAVQNGGGPSAFQMRLRREPWPASDVAAAIAAMGQDEAGRAVAGGILGSLAESLIRGGRRAEGTALARTVVRLWPDDSERQLRPVRQALWDPTGIEPWFLRELAPWFDALVADRRREDGDLVRWVREQMPDSLANAGFAADAIARLRRDSFLALDPGPMVACLLREADIWLHTGFPREAATAAARCSVAAAGDEGAAAEADRRLRAAKAVKGDVVTLTTPFEIGNNLRTAERAAGGNDPERAAAEWQRAIESGRDVTVKVAGGRLRGAAAYAAGRLRKVGGDVLAAWRSHNDERAATAFARDRATADPAVLERIAARWPVASCAGDVLARAADLWAQRGAWQLALGSAAKALAETQPADRSHVLARAAYAAARCGARGALDDALAAIAKDGKPVALDGAQVPPARFAEAMRALLPPRPAEPDPTAVAAAVRLPLDGQAVGMAARVGGAHRAAAGLVADGLLLAATAGDFAAVDLASGTLRWRLPPDVVPNLGTTAPSDATPEAGIAAEGGIAVAKLMRGGRALLVAVDLASGRQLWSSDAVPGLATCAAMTAPCLSGGRVWGWFAGRDRSVVACLDAGDGHVLWTSALGTGGARQPIEGVDLTLAGHSAAPLLQGRDLVVCTDAGLVASLDAVTGVLQWVHTYTRAAPDLQGGGEALGRLLARGAGVIAGDEQRVYVAPRDTLSVLALDRATGAVVWADQLRDVRELAGLSAGGLVVADGGVACLDPASGAERWRWQPGPGSPRVLGRPALGTAAAWVGTEAGLLRLSLDRGTASAGPAWSALGIDGDFPAALAAGPQGLVGCGNGAIVLLRPGKAGPRLDLAAGQAATTMATGAQPVAAGQRPAAMAAAWELPVGTVASILRPRDAQGGELYAVTADAVVRVDAAKGAATWSTPVPRFAWRGMQVAGDAVMTITGTVATVLDRASGRLRWSASMEPDAVRQLRDAWNPVAIILDPGSVTTYRYREDWWTVRDAATGKQRGGGRSEGGIVGIAVRGDVVHAFAMRGRHLWVDLRDIASGVRVAQADLGIEGDDWASIVKLADGTYLASNHHGAARWDPEARSVIPLQRGMGGIHAVWKDGERYEVFGQVDNKFSSFILDPKAGIVAQEQIIDRWTNDWTGHLGLVERLAGDTRVRVLENRGDKTGILGRRIDGGEAFWIPTQGQWQRWYIATVPMGGRAVCMALDRDGRMRAQLVDPQAGAIIVDSPIPGTSPWPRPVPVECDGTMVYGTARGLVGLIGAAAPVAAPDPAHPELAEAADWALRPVQEPLATWRYPAPTIDGRLDDWGDAAQWDVPQIAAWRRLDAGAEPPRSGMRAHAAWGDDGLRLAFELPVPVGAVERCTVAVDLTENEYRGGDAPLLLALDWDDGTPVARMLSSPMADDPNRPRPQARAAAAGGTTWELQIPWGWLWGHDDRRPGREHGLRAGMAAWVRDPQGRIGALEWGDGLVRGLDKAGLVRLRLEEKAPPKSARNDPQNLGFELPGFPIGQFAYTPMDAMWTFTEGAGISCNQSAFTGGNPPAPEGMQCAFLQNKGSIEQDVKGFKSGGRFRIAFQVAQRPGNQQTIEVFADGQSVGKATPKDQNYEPFTSAPFVAKGATVKLRLAGLNPKGGDQTVMVDAIRIVAE